MINISDISGQNIAERFGALPEKLRAIIQSEDDFLAIRAVCVNNLVTDEDRIEAVRQIAALVVLGIVKLDDMARDIDEALDMNNLKLATAIVSDIKDKVFSDAENDIEKNYQPPTDKTEKLLSILEESIVPVKQEQEKASPQTINIGETFISPNPTMRAELPVEKTKAPLGEFERLDVEKKIPPSKLTDPMVQRQAIGNRQQATRQESAGRVDYEDQQQGQGLPTVSETEPPPAILQREEAAAPAKSASEFKISAPTPKISEVRDIPAPPRAAKIEIGGSSASAKMSEPPKPAPPPRPPVPKMDKFVFAPFVNDMKRQAPQPPAMAADTPAGPRVVHYTGLKSELENPSQNQTVAQQPRTRIEPPAIKPRLSPDEELSREVNGH